MTKMILPRDTGAARAAQDRLRCPANGAKTHITGPAPQLRSFSAGRTASTTMGPPRYAPRATMAAALDRGTPGGTRRDHLPMHRHFLDLSHIGHQPGAIGPFEYLGSRSQGGTSWEGTGTMLATPPEHGKCVTRESKSRQAPVDGNQLDGANQ